MKKILLGILGGILAATAMLGASCGAKASFTKPTLTEPGTVTANYGFVSETENYVYFINGKGTSSDDNSFGTPVKGSLMVASKAALAKGENDAQIVVPKLFVSSDYKAGFIISEGYVYYGTPCTDKNSSGAISNGELTFMRTSLKGEQSGSDIFFTASALSVEYRLVEKDKVVYIVYKDTVDSSIKCYNTSDKTTTCIFKTDAKNNEKDGDKNRFLSLADVKFSDMTHANETAVFFTATVYTEKYHEDKATREDYTRATAKYNILYAYKAGAEKAEIVLDGESSLNTYAVTLIKNGLVFYTATDVDSKVKTYAVKTSDYTAAEITNSTYAVEAALINSLDEVYFIDTEKTYIVKSSLIDNEADKWEKVLLSSTKVTTMLFVNGESLYYFNSDGAIARVKLCDDSAVEERVSAGTADSAWYTPTVVTVDGKPFVFYCDTTTVGSSYVYCCDLSQSAILDDADDEDETNDVRYIEKTLFIGKMLPRDLANTAVEDINAIESVFEWTVKDDKFSVASVEKARATYDGLGEEAKENVAEASVTKLTNCEKAVKLAAAYYNLKGITTDNKADYKTKYDEAVALRQSIIDELGKTTYESLRDMISEQIKSYKTTADDVFGN